MDEIRLQESSKRKMEKRVFSMIYTKVCAIIFALIMAIPNTRFEYESDEQNGMISLLILYGCLVIHELIRSLFLKKYANENNVYFGMKKGLIYAATSSSVFTRFTYIMSCITPFLIITFSLTLFLFTGILPKLVFVLVSFFYAILRLKYFYWMYEIIRAPKNAKIEIAGVDMKILGNLETFN